MSDKEGKCGHCSLNSHYDLLMTCPTCQGSGIFTVPDRVIVGKFFVPRIPHSTFYFNRPAPFYPPAFYPLHHPIKTCCTHQLRPDPCSCKTPDVQTDKENAKQKNSEQPVIDESIATGGINEVPEPKIKTEKREAETIQENVKDECSLNNQVEDGKSTNLSSKKHKDCTDDAESISERIPDGSSTKTNGSGDFEIEEESKKDDDSGNVVIEEYPKEVLDNLQFAEGGDGPIAGCSYSTNDRGNPLETDIELVSIVEEDDEEPESCSRDQIPQEQAGDEEENSEQNTIRYVPPEEKKENDLPNLQWGDYFEAGIKEESDELESTTTEFDCSSLNSFHLHDIIEDPIGEAVEEGEQYELRRVVKMLEIGTQTPDKNDISTNQNKKKMAKKTVKEEPIPDELRLPELQHLTPKKTSQDTLKKARTLSPRDEVQPKSPLNTLAKERIRRAALERKKSDLELAKMRQDIRKEDSDKIVIKNAKKAVTTPHKRWNY